MTRKKKNGLAKDLIGVATFPMALGVGAGISGAIGAPGAVTGAFGTAAAFTGPLTGLVVLKHSRKVLKPYGWRKK